MNKVIYYLLFFIPVFLLLSCDCEAKDSVTLGAIIINYPEWCAGHSYEADGIDSEYLCYGYSDWMDWQSDAGIKLHSFVSDNIISDEYPGRFRLLCGSQHLYICFNDISGTSASFFSYIGKGNRYHKEYMIEQSDPNVFEYQSWFRPYHTNGFFGHVEFDQNCLDENRSFVKMTKISDFSFNYQLEINGSSVIDAVLSNINKPVGYAIIDNWYSWIPSSITYKNTDDTIFLWNENGKIELGTFFGRTLFCFEGIELRNIDSSKKLISFNLLDSLESDFADFVEIEVIKEESALGKLSYYRNKNGVISLVKQYNDVKINQYY